jgi:anti-sigma regulatory factor (Ser/Thr protein kinase)
VSEERIELTLRADPESLAQMRRALGRWLRAAGADDTEAYETLVATGEACANAIAHAYPPGEASYVVEARRQDDGVEIRVRDFGSWRAPRAGSQGRGLGLIEELMDAVDIDRGTAGTTVRMRRSLGSQKIPEVAA